MDLPLLDATEIPLPPEDVRFRRVHADPLPDGGRLRLDVRVTPFQQRPNLEIWVIDPEGSEVASTNVIEALSPELGLTLHLRSADPGTEYRLRLQLVYPDQAPVDRAEICFHPAGPPVEWPG